MSRKETQKEDVTWRKVYHRYRCSSRWKSMILHLYIYLDLFKSRGKGIEIRTVAIIRRDVRIVSRLSLPRRLLPDPRIHSLPLILQPPCLHLDCSGTQSTLERNGQIRQMLDSVDSKQDESQRLLNTFADGRLLTIAPGTALSLSVLIYLFIFLFDNLFWYIFEANFFFNFSVKFHKSIFLFIIYFFLIFF